MREREQILRKICKMLVCYIPNCNFSLNKWKSLDLRKELCQIKRFSYAYKNYEINFDRIREFK